MDLISFVHLVRRHVVLIAVVTVVGGALGVASAVVGGGDGSAAAEASGAYVARRVVTFDSDAIAASPVAEFRTVEQLARLATTPTVATRAGERIGTTADAVVGSVNTYAYPTIDVVEYAAFARDPDAAARKVDAVVDSLLEYVDERSTARIELQNGVLTERLDDLRAQRRMLDARLADPGLAPSDRDEIEAERDAAVNAYRLAYERLQRLADVETTLSTFASSEPVQAQAVSGAEFDAALARARAGTGNLVAGGEPADATTASASSASRLGGPVPRGLLGAVFGCIVAVGIAVVRERMDSHLYTRADFESAYPYPVLAEVPTLARRNVRHRRVSVVAAPFSRAAEAYRLVRSSVLLLDSERGPDALPGLVVMVTSPGPREGKTTTVANLAAVFGESGLRVLAVNCDFRRPALHRHFDVPLAYGEIVPTSVRGVSVVANVATAAGETPTGVVTAQKEFVEAQRSHFDVILMDTAPLLATNDPLEVSAVADLAVVVGRPGTTRRDQAERTCELLERHRVHTAGVVLVGADAVTDNYYYYYSRDALPEGEGRAPRSRSTRSRRPGGTVPRVSRPSGADPVTWSAPRDPGSST